MRRSGVRKRHGSFAVPGIIRDVTRSGELLMLLAHNPVQEDSGECTDLVS